MASGSTSTRIARNSGKAAARHAKTLRTALPMPGDVRLMNAVASVVFVLAGLGVLVGSVLWLMRAPMFPIRNIVLDGDLARNSVLTIRANASPRLTGNFFSVDLQQARAAFESVPWVRHAVVRRVWPDQLVVQLEEHHAAAWWQGPEERRDEDHGADRLVNSFGEVFEANVGDVDGDGLPSFSGPDGSAAPMLALYQRLRPTLARLDMVVTGMHVSVRGSWRVRLASGAAIELGRGSPDELLARCERFAGTFARVVVPGGHRGYPLEYADLRHAEGYAMRLRGLGSQAPAAAGSRTAARAPARSGARTASNNNSTAAAARH